MGIKHVEVALVGGQVDRFADHAARMMQPRQGLVQLHEFDEIGVGGIAAAAVEIVHERRSPRGAEHRGIAAKLHVIGGIARMLDELAWRRGLDGAAAEARLEAHPRALNVASRVMEDRQDFRIAVKLHSRVLENGLGVAFDELEALRGEHIEGFELTGDERGPHGRCFRILFRRGSVAASGRQACHCGGHYLRRHAKRN